MVGELAYFPAVLKEIVQKVSEKTNTGTDPFTVIFKHGLFQDVSKAVYAEDLLNTVGAAPLVWLIVPFEQKGAEVTCDLIIALPTEAEWTQEQRDENSYFPRLLPVFQELKKQITKAKALNNTRLEMITPTWRWIPYFGGEESGNVNQKNLFGKNIDAIQIRNLQLTLRADYKPNC